MLRACSRPHACRSANELAISSSFRFYASSRKSRFPKQLTVEIAKNDEIEDTNAKTPPLSEKWRTLLPARPYFKSARSLATVLNVFERRQINRKSAKAPSRWSSPTLANEQTIKDVIEKSHLLDYAGKTIIEVSPGPGLFAEKLIEMVKPARYIALEPRSIFIPVLESLKAQPGREHNTEVHVRSSDGFNWSSYTDLENEKLLEIDKLQHPRDEINPNLVLIATAKAANMDQLVTQWIDTIGTSSWLQKYGRVRMYLFVNRPIRQRLLAQPGSPFRTKGTFIREATCDIKEILLVPYVQDKIHSSAREHWKQDFEDLPQSRDAIIARPDHYLPPTALSLLEINPHKELIITAAWDTFDFLTKNLLINKSTPLYQQIRTIASGAYALLESLRPELRAKKPQNMTVQDLNEISLAFDKWPFKPKYLYTETYSPDTKRAIARKAARDMSLSEVMNNVNNKRESRVHKFLIPASEINSDAHGDAFQLEDVEDSAGLLDGNEIDQEEYR